MLSRHRKEILELQNKEIDLKKAAAKGSKAEQKAKKKQVEEEISKLAAKLKEKHAEELASLGYNRKSGSEKSILDYLVKAIAGVSVTNQPDQPKSSKEYEEAREEGSTRSSKRAETTRRTEQHCK